MKPKLIFALIVAAFLAVLVWSTVPGCSSVAPGADPVVVNAERSIQIAFETCDAFLKIEKDNEAFCIANLPQVDVFAEQLRSDQTKNLFRAARKAEDVYKATKTPADATKANDLAAQVQALARQARLMTAQLTTAKKGA